MLQVSPIQAASRLSVKLLQRAFWSSRAMLVLAVLPLFASAQDSPIPPKLSALRSEGRNIVISWEGGAGPYQLYTRSSLSSPWVEMDAPTDGTSITAVKTEQMAFFRVSSGRGNSTDRKAPSTPAGLRATALSCNEVSLSWSSASDTGTGVKGYMVYRDGVFLKTVLAPDTSTSDTGTDGATAYSYSVRSYDFANNLSGLSAPLTVTTPQCEDMQPPTTPINIVATVVTSNQVDLRWQASSDTGGSGLAGYLVYAGAAYIGGSSTPSYSARGLAAGQEHCFTVIAYDGNGNSSSPSLVTCARTAAGGSPANDNFAGRLNLAAVGADANNLGATKEAGEPQHAGNAGGKSVWWTWTAPASQYDMVITTAGSSFDTLLAVYKGSAVSGLTPVASNDNDPNGGVSSLVRFYPEPGATYSIAVDGKDGAAGTIRLQVAICSMIVFPLEASFGPIGGNGTVHVGSVSGCSWTAMSLSDWITLTSGASGNGSGNVGFVVDSNTSAAERIGYIIVEGSFFMVMQDGAPCGSALSHYTAFYGAAGGDGTVTVNSSAPDCAWNSVSDVGWLTVTSGSSGAGSRDVAFRVAANTGIDSRTGTLTIAGQKFTITQGGAACSYALSSNGATFPHAGGASSVNVSALAGCNWSVASDREWLIVTSGAPGNGSGTVTFSVLGNGTTVERSGTLTIGGQSFRVTQAAGPCSFTVSPLATNVPAGGGAAAISIAAGAGCNWTAVSQSQWITVTAGANGVASGSVTFSFGSNPGSTPRAGTLLVAGKTITVNQAGTPCDYTLSQSSGSFPSAASSGSVNVSAGFDCNWTALPGASWITITSGGSGPGNGTIRFNLAANTAAAPRNSSISVGGRTYSISQDGVACSYSFSSPNGSAPAAGGSGSVNVVAPSGCTWNAVTNAPWLTITSSRSGNGSGTITYSAGPNPTASARSATISVGGQTYTVNQPAETTAPPAPTGLSALPANCSEINVAWFAVTDQGGSGLRAYRVFRNGQFIREVSSTSTTDSGLSGSTTYSYTVQAVDNAGNLSGSSAAVLATTPVCPPPAQDWARSFGGTGGENGQAVAVDSAGNVVLGGWFSGSVDFGGGPLASTTPSALFLAKYGQDGSHLWSKRFTANGNPFTVEDIKVDANQNIIMAGYFSGNVNFGGTLLTSLGGQDIFVAKFDSTGRHLWSQSHGGLDTDLLNSLAVDRGGNVIVAGSFNDVANLGGNHLGAAWSGMHGFVAKYDPNGAHVWSKDFASSADYSITGVAVDSSNNILVGGFSLGSVNMGGEDLAPIMGGGNGDTFVAKLSPTGGHIWSKRLGGLYADKATTITVDSGDNVILGGIFAYQGNFGGTNLVSPAGFDIFIAKYDSAGNHSWSKSIGSLSNDEAYSITTDSAQNVIVAGYYRAYGNFGGPQIPIKGGYDLFIAKYNSRGEYVWVDYAGDTSTDVAYSVTTDAMNNVVVSGNFIGTITLGSRTLTSAGSYDGFVYRRAP